MNLYSAVRLSGACVAALTVAVLPACSSATVGDRVSTTPPLTGGLGDEWMEPGTQIEFSALDLVLAEPKASEQNRFDGVGMFDTCVVTVTANKQVDGFYEIALVKDDGSDSIANIPDATNAEDADSLFATHRQECTA